MKVTISGTITKWHIETMFNGEQVMVVDELEVSDTEYTGDWRKVLAERDPSAMSVMNEIVKPLPKPKKLTVRDYHNGRR